MKIENIVVHCSDSEFGNVDIIRDWHTSAPRNWRDIGYNIVILNGIEQSKDKYNHLRDGIVDVGRGLDFDIYMDRDERAAHTLNYNQNSIGVCMIGTNRFTEKQFDSLVDFCKLWKKIIPEINILGHKEMSTARGKTCPNFNMNILRESLGSDMKVRNSFKGFIHGL